MVEIGVLSFFTVAYTSHLIKKNEKRSLALPSLLRPNINLLHSKVDVDFKMVQVAQRVVRLNVHRTFKNAEAFYHSLMHKKYFISMLTKFLYATVEG